MPRRLALLGSLALAALAAVGCRAAQISEARREDGLALGAAAPGVAVLPPTASPSARDSIFLYPALPLVWFAQMISLHWPERAPDAVECLGELRSVLDAHLDAVGLHPLDGRVVDKAVATNASLRDLGADYVLHSEIRSWSRSYWIIHAKVKVSIAFQLVRLSDGLVAWEGVVHAARETGLLQVANLVAGSAVSAPIAGLPVGQVSALTGPPGSLRGSALTEAARDAARLLAIHLTLDRTHGEKWPDDGNRPTPVVRAAAVVGYDSRPYGPGDVLEVTAVAPAGALLTFDLGASRNAIPMFETGRGFGADASIALFRGSYVIPPKEIARTTVVTVRAVSGGRPSAPFRIEESPIELRSGG